MKAIVTGGTGFIGSWLILELLHNNYDVTAIVRNKQKLLPEILENRKCRCIEKTIEDLSKEDFESNVEYEVFFHLAWGGVSAEHKNDVGLQLNNVSMAIKALEICHEISCKKFIASGTVAEYALCTDMMDLNAKQTPNDMYGAAKVSAHFFLDIRARQLSQPFIWLVIPSTFGERRNDSNILAYTINMLLKGEKPLYGSLEQMWDFLYVGEVARAIRCVAERGIFGKVYGIGSGTYRTLKEYIVQIRDIINPDLELGIGSIPSMSQQTFSSCVNIYDLIKDTGFTPKISFEEGIRRTINYYAKKIKEERDAIK